MPVAGLRGTGDWGEDQRPKNFREMILMRRPTGNAPIFALSSQARKKTTDDPEFSWWDEPTVNIRLEVNGAHASGATVINVDSSDPSASSPELQYGLATHLKAGDILQAEATETTAYNLEHLEVVQVLSATQIIVKRGVAGSVAGSISDDSFLTLIGSAYAEGTPAPAAVSRNPIKYHNFTQIFKDTYELSGTANETKTRTGQEWSQDKERKTFDHARGIEWALLYGRRHETTGENGKPKRFTGGLRQFIPAERTTIFGGTTTYFNFLDAVYPVFDFETGAGDTRIAFCGNGALNALNKVVAADNNTEIHFGNIVKVYGIAMRELILPQGRIMLRTHPLMNQHSKYTNSMFLMDFDSFNYRPMQNRDTKARDDVQTKDEDVRRGFYMTECGFQVDRGGLTMGYLGNINHTPE